MKKKIAVVVAVILAAAVVIYGAVDFITSTCPIVGIVIAALAFTGFAIYMDKKEEQKKINSRKARK